MVKVDFHQPDFQSSFVLLVCFSDTPGTTDKPWHLVYPYGPDDQYLLAAGWALSWHPDIVQAYIAARSFVSLAQVVTDYCPITHGSLDPGFNGPGHPRFNIYRGIRGEPLVPAILWDFLEDDPPPGYLWY